MKLELNLLKHSAFIQRKQSEQNKAQLFDIIRKKYVAATPEEWVRQLFIHYLLSEKGINKNKISVEKQLIVNGLQKRFDIVIYDDSLAPHTLIECKAPSVAITDDVFRQASTYNLVLKAPFLMVTNGQETYHCAIDFDTQDFRFLNEI
jgi:type I site-specific restriction endonuclease